MPRKLRRAEGPTHSTAGDPFAVATFDPAVIDAMTRDLEGVANGDRPTTPVTCVMAQALLHIR